MKPVCVGGRIKSAAVGLDYLYSTDGIVTLEKRLRGLRENPPEELRDAYFPIEEERLHQMLRGVGFYRPMLKTDQGMGGNFMPFWIDATLERSDLDVRTVLKDEIIAIEEQWYTHERGHYYHYTDGLWHNHEQEERIDYIKRTLSLRNCGEITLKSVNASIKNELDLLGRREVMKGRLPLFFIRPALLDRPLILGADVMQAVTNAVARVMTAIEEKARELQWGYCKRASTFQPNVLYCQPDVFVFADGSVVVEKINYPDVGLFLRSLHDPDPAKSALSGAQQVVGLLEENVCATIIKHTGARNITLVTRDEVVFQGEDTLEIQEIKRLEYLLGRDKIQIDVYTLSEVPAIPHGSSVVLMNVDYRADGADALLARHCRGELMCYPTPFVQVASQSITGLEERVIDPKYQSRFLQLIGSLPKDDHALQMTWRMIENVLFQNGVTSDIVHADIGTEVVPIFRRSLHSWRQLKNRIERYPHDKPVVKLRLIPATPDNLLVKSATGSRLHSFRFMFVAS